MPLIIDYCLDKSKLPGSVENYNSFFKIIIMKNIFQDDCFPIIHRNTFPNSEQTQEDLAEAKEQFFLKMISSEKDISVYSFNRYLFPSLKSFDYKLFLKLDLESINRVFSSRPSDLTHRSFSNIFDLLIILENHKNLDEKIKEKFPDKKLSSEEISTEKTYMLSKIIKSDEDKKILLIEHCYPHKSLRKEILKAIGKDFIIAKIKDEIKDFPVEYFKHNNSLYEFYNKKDTDLDKLKYILYGLEFFENDEEKTSPALERTESFNKLLKVLVKRNPEIFYNFLQSDFLDDFKSQLFVLVDNENIFRRLFSSTVSLKNISRTLQENSSESTTELSREDGQIITIRKCLELISDEKSKINMIKWIAINNPKLFYKFFCEDKKSEEYSKLINHEVLDNLNFSILNQDQKRNGKVPQF